MNFKSVGKAAFLSAWLLPMQGQRGVDFINSSLGAAAFVHSSAAPVLSGDAGSYLVKTTRILPASTEAENWQEAHALFGSFRDLEADWDDAGASAPIPGVVDGAISLALHLDSCGAAPPTLVHPGINGSIFFEWSIASGYVEVEVTSPVEAVVRWFPKAESDVFTAILRRETAA